MTGNLPSGVTDADIDKAAPGYWPDESLPCNWEHMSGECLYCGAQIGEPCGWDGNRGRKE